MRQAWVWGLLLPDASFKLMEAEFGWRVNPTAAASFLFFSHSKEVKVQVSLIA